MNPSKVITVLLAEDHNVMRQGLRSLLDAEGHFHVVGEARNGREAVKLAQAVRPDVTVMDISMPLLNGLEAARQILKSNPTAKIVMLSAHSDDAYVDMLFKIGVFAFLEKHTSMDVLIRVLRKAAAGITEVSPAFSKRLQQQRKSLLLNRHGRVGDGLPHLTIREREVLQLVAEGMANKQCASELHVSIKTIEKHRQSVMSKLNVHNTAGLTRYAIATGVISVNPQLTIT